MADQTIDAIKVRLGVNTDDIAAGVRTANEQLDKIGSKTRVVRVRVEAVRANTGAQSLHLYMQKQRKDAKTPIQVPVAVQPVETGQFGVGKLRTKIATSLAKDGGVNVPIKIKLSAADAAAIRKDISTQIGSVDIYFNWVARNKPGPPPDGGSATGGGTGAGPSGGAGGGASGTTAHGARQPGETRAEKRARNQAEHAAAQAQKRVDREAAKTAGTQQQALAKELADLKAARDEIVAGMAPDATKPGRTDTQKRLDAEVAAQRKVAKDADDRAARTTSQQVKERAQRKAERARATIVELNKERAVEAKRLRIERAATTTTAGGEPAAAGTGSRPRTSRAKTATGAPATGTATTTPAAAGAYVPHKGVPLPGTRFAGKSYRTSGRPQGFGADFGYASGTDATMIRGIQGVQELQAQGIREQDMAAFVAKAKAAGVNPADPDETQGFLRSMKGSARRKMFGRLGPAGAEGDPLDDPQVLSAFLGRLQTIGEGYAGQVEVSGGRVANRLAGARGRKGEGGRAGGGGGIAGTKGSKTRTGKVADQTPTTRPEDIEIPEFHQGYVEGAAQVVAGMTPDDRGYYDIGGKKFRAAGAAQALGRQKFEADQAEALGKQQAIKARMIGVGPTLTDEQKTARDKRDTAAAAEAKDLSKRRAAIRRKLVKQGVPAAVMGEAIEAELRGQTRGAQPKAAAPAPAAAINPFAIAFSGGIGPASPATYAGALAGRYARMKGITGVEAARETTKFLGGRKLPYRMYPEGYAEGGRVTRTGLLGRMAAAGHQPSIAMLGERGPELAVSDEKGETEIVPTHQVPQWLQRAREGKGFGKDLTHHATGGSMGGGFTFRGRQGFTSKPPNIVSATGMIQRVFVVNWPAAMQAAAGQQNQQAAAGPLHAAAQALNQAAASLRGAGGGAAGGGGGGGGGGGAGAAAGGGAGAAAGGGGGIPSSAAERESAAFARRRAGATGLRLSTLEESRLRLTGIRSDISEKQALSPVRALSVSFGQIFSTLTGRADIVKRSREASSLADIAGQRGVTTERLLSKSRQQAAELKAINEYEKAGNVLTDKQKAKQEDLVKTIRNRGQLIKQSAKDEKEAIAAATDATKHIVTTTSAVKNIAASAVGISVGTLAFSAAYGALNTGVEAFVDISEKAIERATGWHNVAAKVTGDLSDQAREANGATKQVVALAEAHTGLALAATSTLAPMFEQRVSTEAGNKALSAQLDQLHAMRAIAAQGGTGQYDSGLTQTTGGLNILGAQTNIGGVPSFYEQINNELRGQSAITGAPAPKPGGIEGALRDAVGTAIAVNPATAIPNALLNLGGGGVGPLGPGNGPETTPQAKEANRQFSAAFLTDLSDAAKRAGGQLDFVAAISGDLQAKQATQIDLLSQSTIPAFRDLASTLKLSDTAINTTATSLADLQDYLLKGGKAAVTGASIPDPKQLVKALTDRILPAHLGGIAREGAFERNIALPSATALRRVATPLVSYNDPRLRPSIEGSQGSGGKSDYAKAFAAYADKALPAQKAITAEIDKGKQALMDMGVPKTMLDDIGTLGKDIQNIQLGISQRGLNLQVAEYNNQLRIANRSLKDAKDFMAGIHGATGDTLGAIEGQNAALSRQLQLLQFELSQRQINFRLATAGFMVAGQSPEERAARLEDAKTQAAFAQKQLDLQKQIAGNEFRGVGISAGRNITDLRAQIGLLTQGKGLTIDTAAAQASIEALQEQQDILIQKAQSYSSQGQKIAALYMSTVTDMQTQVGRLTGDMQTDLVHAFEAAGAGFVRGIRTATDPNAYDPGSRDRQLDGPRNGPGKRGATGYLGYHSTPTQLTIGEAAGEEVAILRNPRRMMVQMGGGGVGGGGGGTVQIIIQNPVVREENDITKITASVVRALNTRTALLGLR